MTVRMDVTDIESVAAAQWTRRVSASEPRHSRMERSHRVDDQEFYRLLDKDGIMDDVHLFNEKLREWENYYNYHRPHGALDGQTPVRTVGRQGESGIVTGVLRLYT
jgi:transposase InsO family protein